MSNQNNQSNPPADLPLLRMFHPTSGRANFNDVNNQVVPPAPAQPAVDPRMAAILNRQTQQAIGAANALNPFPNQNSIPQHSTYMYGNSSPYTYGNSSPYTYGNSSPYTYGNYSPYTYGNYSPYHYYYQRR